MVIESIRPKKWMVWRGIIGSILVLSLFLSLLGCMNGETEEFDVRVKDNLGKIQFQLAADGSPVIMADIELKYTTKKLNERSTRDTITRNIEAILLTRKNGTWTRHSFRNIQNPWSGQSLLLKNYKGEVQPFVFDLPNISLFGSDGGAWLLKKRIPEEQFPFENYFKNGQTSISLAGSDLWQTVSESYNVGRPLRVIRSDKSKFTLDSNITFNGQATFSTRNISFAIGTVEAEPQSYPGATPPFVDSLNYLNLVSYSWSNDSKDPKPQKQIIHLENPLYAVFFDNIAEVNSVFIVTASDSIMEFGFKERELVYLRSIAQPDDGIHIHYSNGTVIDRNGCVHGLNKFYKDTSNPNGPSLYEGIGYAHMSSCSDRQDTLVVPLPNANDRLYDMELSDLKVAKYIQLGV